MDGDTSGDIVLHEPAQSKHTWTCYKSHSVWEFTGKMPDADSGDIFLCEPAQSKRTWTCYKSHFVWKFKGKMPDPNPPTHVLCEPAQSKCIWTCHKSHFVWKFRGKMPHAPATTWIKHRALTVTVRTLSVWLHCLGKNAMWGVCSAHPVVQ